MQRTKRSHLKFVALDLAILARVMDNPAVSGIEIARHFSKEEKIKKRQRPGYQAVGYTSISQAVRRLKLLGLLREGDPYDVRGIRETGLKHPGKTIPLYLTGSGKQVLKDHLLDIAGVEI